MPIWQYQSWIVLASHQQQQHHHHYHYHQHCLNWLRHNDTETHITQQMQWNGLNAVPGSEQCQQWWCLPFACLLITNNNSSSNTTFHSSNFPLWHCLLVDWHCFWLVCVWSVCVLIIRLLTAKIVKRQTFVTCLSLASLPLSRRCLRVWSHSRTHIHTHTHI